MNQGTMQLIMIVVLFAIMYFLLIRPQKKQEKAVREMRASLKVGDDIITIGGICGKIVRIKEERLTIQVGSDKTKFDIEKWAVSRVDEGSKGGSTKRSQKSEDKDDEKKVTPKSIKKLGKAEAEEAAEAPASESAAVEPAEEK